MQKRFCGTFAQLQQHSLALLFTAAMTLAAQQPPPGVTKHSGLTYATTPQKELQLDLYLPDGVVKPPLVVWIHGGAWLGGNRDRPPVNGLLRAGFAVASITYRLSHEAIFPAQIHDCKAAVRWLRANASKYGYDATRTGVWGPSAGGHLVALLGTSGDVKELEGSLGNPDQSSRVQAVVDFYGPSDLTRMGEAPEHAAHNEPNSPESKLVGGAIPQNRDKALRASPVTYISKDDPPFLIYHGDKDPTVPFSQSEILHNALKQAGVPSEFHPVPGAGHGGPAFNAPEIQERIRSFFDQHLRQR